MKDDFYKNLIQNAVFGYAYHRVIYDENGNAIDYEFLEVNPAFEKLTGLSSEKIIGKTAKQIFPDIIHSKFDWIGYYGKIASGNSEDLFEQYSEVINTWYQVQVNSNEKGYFSTIFWNITKHKKDAEELERFFTVNLDLLCIADIEGNFIKINSEWENVLGYSLDYLKSKKFLEFVHEDDIESTINAIKSLADNDEVKRFVNRYRCKDGTYKHIEWNAHPHGNFIYAAARDITLQKSLLDELENSKRMMNDVFNAIPARLFWKDLDGKYLGCNIAFAKDGGKNSPEDIIGEDDYMQSWAEHAELYRSDDRTVAETGISKINFDEPVVKVDGNLSWVRTTKIPLRDNKGKIYGIMGTFEDVTDKKIYEDKIRESEEKYRLIAENSSDVIWTINLQGEFTYVSPSVLKLRGYTPEEVFKQSIDEALTPNSIQHYIDGMEVIKRNIHEGKPFPEVKLELEQPCKDGSTVWTEATINGIHKSDDKIIGILGVTRDISERKVMQDALIDSVNRFNILATQSNTVSWDVDKNGLYTYISDNVEKAWGYKPEELIGKLHFYDLHPIENRSYFKELGLRMISGSNPISNLENPVVKSNGEIIWVISSGVPVFDKNDGSVIGFRGSDMDITGRKLSEEALKESEEKLKTIFGTANIGISITDQNGFYVMFNKWWTDFLGYSEEELKSITNIDITHRDDVKESRKMFEKLINKEINRYRLEKRFISKNNKTLWGDLSVSAIFDDKGDLINVVGMIIDITEQKIAEEKLRNYSFELEVINEELRYSKEIIETHLLQKNALIDELEDAKNELELSIKEKDKFFSIIAHDLRNPLGNFRNTTEMLHESRTEFTDEELMEFLEMLKISADNVYSLLENLLEWSRSQRGTLPFNPTPITLKHLAKNTLSLLSPSADAKNINLHDLLSEDILLFADANMLTTILRNLLSNAIKFTPEGGTIGIGSSRESDDEIIIFIKDNGIGMEQSTIDKLFKIDQNVTTQGTSGEKGTGLGLILCKEFVEKHGGRIWVESTPGSGTTFYFTMR